MTIKELMGKIENKIKENPALVEQVNGIFKIVITGKDSYLINAKDTPGVELTDESSSADCTVKVAEEDFQQLLAGELNVFNAFSEGKLGFEGDMEIAMRLGGIIQAAKPTL